MGIWTILTKANIQAVIYYTLLSTAGLVVKVLVGHLTGGKAMSPEKFLKTFHFKLAGSQNFSL